MKNKNTLKNYGKQPISGGVKKGLHAYVLAVLAVTLMFTFITSAYASGTPGGAAGGGAADPLAVINNLSDFIFSLIRAIGLILVGLGIVQVGLSLKSHDPSQRANGFLALAGGIIIMFTKEILSVITG